MNNTTAPAFTAADVAALAEMILPALAKTASGLPLDLAIEAAVCMTEQTERDDFDRRIIIVDQLAAAMLAKAAA